MENKINIPWAGWEIKDYLGSGSFGSVYEIQRSAYGYTDKAAMKVISIPRKSSDIKELLEDGSTMAGIKKRLEEDVKKVVDEYSLMRKMNGSANVVNCDDFQVVEHADSMGWDVFIRMELLTPLVDTLPENPQKISEEKVIEIAKDLCRALVLCESHGIIHRDIKPSNIFVSANSDYKLGDFGIAKTIEQTMGGTMTGTYKYMAPEVYNNKPYGSAADIYSLGLVLYWLLNERRLPFLPLPPKDLTEAVNASAQSRRLGGEKIPAPAHGSEWLKAIVLKACAYNPEERFASAEEMLKAFDDESTEGPVFIDPPPPPPTPFPWKKTIMAVAVAVIVFVVVLAAGSGDKGDSTPVQTTAPETYTTTVKSTPRPTAKTVSTPSPTVKPASTVAPIIIKSPSSDDLYAINSKIRYPKDSAYLSEYKYGFVDAPKKNSVNGYYYPKPTDEGDKIYFYPSHGASVTVLAIQNGRACVIVTSEQKACWINADYIIYN